MPFTITQPLGRVPKFPELHALARQHQVWINGNEQAGKFQHPDPERPVVTGNYVFEPEGNLRGDFTGNILGKLAGTFAFMKGRADIIITAKPLLLPEPVLKTRLAVELEKFCARFPAVDPG